MRQYSRHGYTVAWHESLRSALFRRVLPDNYSHTQKVVARDFNRGACLGGQCGGEDAPNFLGNIGAAHGSEAVQPGYAVAHDGIAGIRQRQMQRMTDEVVDEQRAPADAQAFADELS